MEVILSEQCISLIGTLERGLGYSIQARHSKKGEVRYYSQRSKHFVPRDGHWRFIVLCAELAHNKLYVTDIRVSNNELGTALNEARIGYLRLFRIPLKKEYNAADVLLLKERIAL